MYYTRRFAERSLRALIVHSSRLEAAPDSLQLEQQFVGNELGYLMLRDSKTMFGVAADAPESPEMDEPRAALYTRVVGAAAHWRRHYKDQFGTEGSAAAQGCWSPCPSGI